MPYTLKWIGSNVFVTMLGEITFDEIIKCNELIYGDYRFDSMIYQLVDFTKITDFNMSEKFEPSEFQQLIVLEKSATRWNNDVKVAIVSTNDFINSLMEEYANSLKDTGWKCGIFECVQSAKKWCLE